MLLLLLLLLVVVVVLVLFSFAWKVIPVRCAETSVVVDQPP